MKLAAPLPRPQLLALMLSVDARPRSPVGAMVSAAALALGVFVLDWPPAAVFGLFWLENVLNGVFFLLRMLGLRGWVVSDNLDNALRNNVQLTAEQRAAQLNAAAGCMHWIAPGLFVVHYGLFCLGHLGAITALFPGWSQGFATAAGWIAIAGMVATQVWDTLAFRRRADLQALPRMVYMMTCYDRVLILHVTLVLGGFLLLLGGGKAVVALLIAFKLWADLRGAFSLSRVIAGKLAKGRG